MDNEKQKVFLESYDFMRLGQALTIGQTDMGMMIVTRLQREAEEAGLQDIFGSKLQGIRQCLIAGQYKEGQDILALVTAGRVRLLNDIGEQ